MTGKTEGFEYQVGYANKIWFPPTKRNWIWARAKQLLIRFHCKMVGHRWGQWRIETEDWFEYRLFPEPYTWTTCTRQCGGIIHCKPLTPP